MSFNTLIKNQRPLLLAGVAGLILFLVVAMLSLFDSTQILGINRWIKPMKFASSITIYFLTLAVYLHLLNGYEKAKKIIAWGVIVLMTGELFLIVMQAARGTTSHFNITTAFDGAVFSAMGLMIFVNSLLVFYLMVLYFRAEINLPNAIVWGLRLGLIIFLVASFEGGYMSAQTGHAVGVKDGGAGLPFVNWSNEGGDLRVAHFIGLHAFQAIPIASLIFARLQKNFSTVLTFAFSILYFVSFSFVFVQALLGKPLLKGF
jgi:hypothetical protein